MVRLSTSPERASEYRKRVTSCRGLAPRERASSTVCSGTSSSVCSEKRAYSAAATKASGTEAAVVPKEVPTSQRVKGISATTNSRKGTERTTLT